MTNDTIRNTRNTGTAMPRPNRRFPVLDRKSTRLNSSHLGISYAVFCLKKNKGSGHGCYCHGVSVQVLERSPGLGGRPATWRQALAAPVEYEVEGGRARSEETRSELQAA